jgi:hypothetical protein
MASGEDPIGTETAALETERNQKTDRADGLTYFWSVTLPRWLDPFAPRIADAFADGTWTATSRSVAAFTPFIALAVGFLVPHLFPGMRDVFTESLLFMVLVIAGAILSGPIGVMMLIGYIAGVLVWGVPPRTAPNYPPLHYFLRRGGSLLISYLLLAIPAIMIPQQARWMAEEMPLPDRTGPAVQFGVQTILYAVGCGLLIYLWSQAMPPLIQPIFDWFNQAQNPEAFAVLQKQSHWLIGTAVPAVMVRMILEALLSRFSPRAVFVAKLEEQRWSNAERRGVYWRKTPWPLRVVLTSSVVTLLFSGIYEGWIDALLVAAATAGLELWRAGVLGHLPDWWEQAVFRVPALFRFVAALFVGSLLSLLVVLPAAGISWRPLLIGVLLTLVMFYLLFPQRSARQEQNLQVGEPA